MNESASNVVRLHTVRDVRELAREHTVEAVEALAFVMNSPGAAHAVRILAANSILDRGWGKPTQPLTGPGGGPIVVEDLSPASPIERAQRLAAILALATVQAAEPPAEPLPGTETDFGGD